jgi:hypothetical protein
MPFQDRACPDIHSYFRDANTVKQFEAALIKQRCHMNDEEWKVIEEGILNKA